MIGGTRILEPSPTHRDEILCLGTTRHLAVSHHTLERVNITLLALDTLQNVERRCRVLAGSTKAKAGNAVDRVALFNCSDECRDGNFDPKPHLASCMVPG